MQKKGEKWNFHIFKKIERKVILMLKKFQKWTSALREKLNEKGQGMVEYALILAAVAIIAVVAIWGTNGGGGLSQSVTDAFGKATTAINTANNYEAPTPTTNQGQGQE